MNRFLFFIAGLFCLQVLTAQTLQISVAVAPPYKNQAEDYFYNASGVNVFVTVTNTGRASTDFKLLPTLKNVGEGFSVSFNGTFSPATTLTLAGSETKVYNYAQLKAHWGSANSSNLAATGKPLNDILNNDLPLGNYQYCFTAIDPATGGSISNAAGNCGNFNLTASLSLSPGSTSAPIIITPANKSTVKPNEPQFLIFNWTPSGQPNKTLYRLLLVDMTENNLAKPEDAFLSNSVKPYFEIDNLVAPNFAYNMSHPPLQKGRRYAIRVQAYSNDKSLEFNNNGISQVTTFVYDDKGPMDFKKGADETKGAQFDPSVEIKVKKLPKDDVKLDLNAGGYFNLSAAYKSDDGGIFYLTVKHESKDNHHFYFYGEHPQKGYAILMEGKYKLYYTKPKIMLGGFSYLPKYKERGGGNFTFDIIDKGQKFIIDDLGTSSNLPFTTLEAIDINDYIHMLPPAVDSACYHRRYSENKNFSFEGLFLGSDGGYYHAAQYGKTIYMVGEPPFAKGQKPEFSKVFIGWFEEESDKRFIATGDFLTLPKGKLQNSKVEDIQIEFRLTEKEPKLNAYPLPRTKSSVTKCSKWTKVEFESNNFTEMEVKLKGDARPEIKAQKSASLIFFYFGDGPVFTIFQNAGINLQYAIEGYDKVCLLKEWYSEVNKSPDYYDKPTKNNFFKYLKLLAEEGYFIDLYIFTHGSRSGIETLDAIAFRGEDGNTISSEDIIKELGNIYLKGQFPIRMVYQMNCHGERLNDAFVTVGAKAVVGTRSINFIPTRFNTFGKEWQGGASFSNAIKTSRNNSAANSLAATGINAELKARILKPGSWKCKSCPIGTSLNDTKNCVGCFFKSFYGIWGERDDTKEEDKPVWEEYNTNKSGTENLLYFSEPIIKGTQPNINKKTVPSW